MCIYIRMYLYMYVYMYACMCIYVTSPAISRVVVVRCQHKSGLLPSVVEQIIVRNPYVEFVT